MSEQRSDGPQVSADGKFWHDGTQWQPVPTERAAAPSPVAKIVIAIVIAFVVIAAGVWVVHSFASANDGVDCATKNVERAQNGEPQVACTN